MQASLHSKLWQPFDLYATNGKKAPWKHQNIAAGKKGNRIPELSGYIFTTLYHSLVVSF